MAEIYGNTTTTPINPDAFADGGSGIIDQTYNPNSSNAQSGKAVADAIKGLKGDKGEPGADGKDYVLTVEDKQEIADIVLSNFVDVAVIGQ